MQNQSKQHDFQEYHLPEHYLIDIEDKKPKDYNQQQFTTFLAPGMMQMVGKMQQNQLSNHNDENLRHVKSQMDIKVEERQIIRNDSNASLKDDVLALQNIKSNVKNAYIKKINSLLSVNGDEEKEKIIKVSDSQQRLKMQKEQLSSGSSNRNVDNDEIKMQKNRESARNSRQRKKLYIGLLEKKVEDLNGQIEGLRQQCEISFKNIHGVIEQNPCLKGMIIEQAQIFEQLAQKEQENGEINEIQSLLTDSYKLKFSATGSRRKMYLKYCFQNITRTLMEGNYGTLLFSSNSIQRNFQVMDDDDLQEYFKQFKEITGFNEDKTNLLSILKRILEHKKGFTFLIKSMKMKQKNLRICQQQLEDQIEEITNQMTPAQFTQLLLNINRQKNDDNQMKQEITNQQYFNREQCQQQQQQQQLLQQYNFMPQLPIELLLNSKTPLMLSNNLIIDPLQISEFIQKKFCKQ